MTDFGCQPTLELMLTLQGWSHGFTASDRDAMKEACDVIRTAVVQPIGLSRKGWPVGENPKLAGAVGEAEYDRAVMQVMCGSMALWLSGKLDEIEVDED